MRIAPFSPDYSAAAQYSPSILALSFPLPAPSSGVPRLMLAKAEREEDEEEGEGEDITKGSLGRKRRMEKKKG